MDEVLDEALVKDHKPAWKGGDQPYEASYGKLMMWFFLISGKIRRNPNIILIIFYNIIK